MSAPETSCQLLSSGSDPDGLLERFSLYRERMAEREEILRHKWFESEKAGRDIGYAAALVSWMVQHRGQWRKERLRQLTMLAVE